MYLIFLWHVFPGGSILAQVRDFKPEGKKRKAWCNQASTKICANSKVHGNGIDAHSSL